MSFHPNTIRIIKLAIVAIFSVLLSVLALTGGRQDAAASALGPSASHTGAPGEDNCASCHSTFPVNSGTGSVTITGVPHDYLPGQQVPITVKMTEQDAINYGFQLTAIDSTGKTVGGFTMPNVSPQPLQIIGESVGGQQRSYIEHTVDGLFTPNVFNSNTWNFTWTAPSSRAGKVTFYVAGNGGDGSTSPSGDYIYTKTAATLSGSAVSNFDGDLQSDLAVFRPSTGVWYSFSLATGDVKTTQWGAAGDKIAPGDYDGDGTTDLALFRPSTGVWYIVRSSLGPTVAFFGSNGDIPVAGDYDGDGKTDIALFRPSNNFWYISQSSAGMSFIPWGVAGDRPAQGDFDGDAKTDISVYRPSNGIWYVINSGTGGVQITNFGLSDDRLAQADYDGDGKTDYAVFRPSTGVWYLLNSSTGFSAAFFGLNGDFPAPADLDGDGKADIVIYRPSNGVWYAIRSSDSSVVILGFGLNGDIPVPSGYLSDAQ